MATRTIPQIRKTSLINALSHPSFSFRGLSTFSHAQLATHLGSSGGLLQRNLSCSPTFRPVLTNPHYGSSFGCAQVSQSSCYSSSLAYANINPSFGKQRRNRGELKGDSSNDICFGSYGLQVLEPAWITSRQILAGQLAMKRNMRGGKLLLRIFPHKPVSQKPAETRMGRGKGSVADWVAGVRAGRILYEINGVPENVARKAISVAATKFAVRTQFVKSRGLTRV